MCFCGGCRCHHLDSQWVESCRPVCKGSVYLPWLAAGHCWGCLCQSFDVESEPCTQGVGVQVFCCSRPDLLLTACMPSVCLSYRVSVRVTSNDCAPLVAIDILHRAWLPALLEARSSGWHLPGLTPCSAVMLFQGGFVDSAEVQTLQYSTPIESCTLRGLAG